MLPENPKNGLSSNEAEVRLKQYGKNTAFKRRKIRPLIELVKKFSSPLLFILIFSSVVSFFLGEHTNALIILLLIFISGILEFVNTYKSEKAIEKLIAKVVTTIVVLRDGKQKEISLTEVVPGDVVLLSAGDIVPADCLVLEANDFFLNQSALTGEPFPAEKIAQPADAPEDFSIESKYAVFMGTSVVTGYAKVLAAKTGIQTEFGKIAQKLEETPPETDFEAGIRKFSYLMLRLTFIMVSFVFVANAFLANRGWLESFIFALAIAIGLTPELLPVIMSICLSRGSIQMSKKEVIVKNLSSIHSFGSMNILCTDKTGTLTQNKIVLIKHTDGFGNTSEKTFYNAYLNSFFHTGHKRFLEDAVREYKKIDISGYRKIDEIPFDFLRRRDSMVVEKDGARTLITKGAPEEIFKISEFYLKNDNDTKPHKFETATKKIFEKQFEELSGDGFRVLALAIKETDLRRNIYKKEDEKGMIFLGFMAFLDPPKEGVKETLDELNALGIEIKILTGDSEVLTKKICTEIGIACAGIVTGEEIEKMNDAELALRAKEATIFARVTPEQKEKIILALKKAGNAVGYLGDGINDAPALHAADIGISVNNGVDVAKETADIILLRKSLRVLKDGVVEGRKTFQNIMKYIMMGLSSNFGNMFSMMAASLFLPFLPMLPPQILLNNFLYDSSQASLSTDTVDEDDIKKPPRWDLSFIKKFMLILGPVSSVFDFLTFGTLLLIFRFSESQFQTGWFLESIATQVFVIYIIRTKKLPFFQSQPSRLLMINTVAAVSVAWIISVSFLGRLFHFTPLPIGALIAIFGIVITYLFLAELVKRFFYKKVSKM